MHQLPFRLLIRQRGYGPSVARVSIELTTCGLWGRRSDRLSYLAVVGRRGVEPRCTCLSDRARRPAGSRPADGRGVEPQRSRARPGSSRSRPPGRFTIHEQRAKVPTPTALRQPAAFEAVPGTCPVHSPRRKTEILIPMPFRAPPRFRRGPGTCPVHLPCEEHEGLGPSHPKVYAIAGRCSSRCANAPCEAVGWDRRAARYAQTGAVVISPPHCVPYPRFELGTSRSWAGRLCQLG